MTEDLAQLDNRGSGAAITHYVEILDPAPIMSEALKHAPSCCNRVQVPRACAPLLDRSVQGDAHRRGEAG